MEELRQCKRCLLLESGEADVYKSVSECIAKISPEEKTDSDTYRNRLDICSACDHLISGTCLKCGCYPELRAAFRRNRCPLSSKIWPVG